MKAFISSVPDGHSRIEFVDEYGNHLDTFGVDEVHVELNRENIEPVARAHKPATLRAWRFYAN